jgi:MFS family permease
MDAMKRPFYGWWIVVAACITFGLAVGLPYYNAPFFYDYYAKTFNWSKSDITLGFPLAAFITFVGPFVVPRFRPRYLILAGTLLTCLAFTGYSKMGGALSVFYSFCFLYMVGYILSGPVAHQIVVSQWFRMKRGMAMGIVYVGVGVVGAAGAPLVKWLTREFGFQTALQILGAIVLLAWPVAIFLLKDRPADIGQFPDGADHPSEEIKVAPRPFGEILRQRAFWLLLIGSACSIGSIGAINQHMKFVFHDQGFTDQRKVDDLWAIASPLILISSIGGRLVVGWLADVLPKKYVMVATYFIVAATIPVLLLVQPHQEYYVYIFSIVFGFGMGADYMLIPLMAAEQFGVNSLARAMAVILPTDTIGQFWFPYAVAHLREAWGDYNHALLVVFGLAFIGTIAIALLPKHDRERDDALAARPAEARG